MNSFLGTFYQGLAKFVDGAIGGLIKGLGFVILGLEGARAIVLALLSSIGCIILLFAPFIIFHPIVLLTFAVLFILPLLGRTFVSYLKYQHYITTEFLYDRAKHYTEGAEKRSFSSYAEDFWRMKDEEEKARRERQRMEQEQIWEEFFRNFQGGQTGGYHQRGGYYQQGSQQGPGVGLSDFVKKYEESADLLGVPYDTDEYEVRLAYRRMAKAYHPDVNKEEGATQRFQKINAAFDFLSKENIERYRRYKANG